MPVTMSTIANRRASTSFEVGGETVNIEYYPARVSAANQAQWNAWAAQAGDMSEEEGKRFLASKVVEMIASWDVVESVNEDGTPGPTVPLDIDHVAAFDPGFIGLVLAAAARAVAQGKESAPTSSEASGASSPTAPAATSPATPPTESDPSLNASA